ncbi:MULTISPECIES: bifunctional diaminohydroxyphosphoribosylaminopyrimidine deaminase/5-amino-6-(5-phosphoribosylamino)uracil reductase RibD [unclassified Brevundimonas]|uniref:bifunctional diaminohydroxyphosphoribosylaminopyrimidine deaminase/5-amino-6-(5-phosphoribosylamino)uracil reductase RibD n=1 Tax=unclassified Brevundimonas TaxID=2622653 RepID=UPI0025C2AE25|nr:MULTISPECIES: bifunctional diaminohydroxyphosphoribosylaminopyrimidine deaminase/5-amino-6-(5-phosphoribosylamino)uracil reductase RibD [unclassified Brevundimonas]
MRPRVTLKLATSLDGKIAMASGESQWITGPQSRQQGHRLRATHDAILVGVETVLADNPQLTARLEGETPKQPLRVVLDSQLRTPASAHLADGAVIYTAAEPRDVGQAEVVRVEISTDGRPSIEAVLADLSARGVSSLLIEGGGKVAASFLRGGLIDAIEWFRAPMILGQSGRSGIAELDFLKLSDAPRFRRLAVEPLGDDLWERYEKV